MLPPMPTSRAAAWVRGTPRGIGDVILCSYELCCEKERLLFDRLSGFAPGFDIASDRAGTGILYVGADLEAIEVVCADDVLIPDGHGGPGAERSDQAGPAVRLARKRNS
jgi:hypothetical protein